MISMSNLSTSENLILQYRLTLSYNNRAVIITNVDNIPFLDCKFNIIKISGVLNSAKISITNVNLEIISYFLKHTTEVHKKINVVLEIGNLKDGLATAFKGTASEINSDKNDINNNMNIEAYDGHYQVENAILNFQMNKESTFLDLKKEMANRLGMNYKQTNSLQDLEKLGKDIYIDSKDALRELKQHFKNQEIIIDNEVISIVDNTELLAKKLSMSKLIYTLKDDNFIEYPRPKGIFMNCTIELDCFILKNSLIKIDLSLDIVYSQYNGVYRVAGVEHDGFVAYMNGDYKNTTQLELQKIIV
jgi:hypothetical protein